MMEKCCKCGKEAVLDEKGMCFDCADTGGKKLTQIQKEMFAPFSKGMARNLFVVFSVVNMFLTCRLIEYLPEMATLKYVPAAIILTCVEWIFLRSTCWEKPIVLFIAKAIVIFITRYIIANIFDSRDSLLDFILICFIVTWIVISIYFLSIRAKKNKKYEEYEENRILEQMKGILSNAPKVIPQYQPSDTEAIWQKVDHYVDRAVNTVRCSDWEDDIKEKVIELIQNRDGELWVDNNIRLYYCKVIENYMDTAFRKYESGDWVNELELDVRNGFKIITKEEIEKASIIVGNYSARELFELLQTARSMLSEQWENFLNREKAIGITRRFQEFRSDSIGIALGEAGEQKVARELQPYEGQIIVLPNLRLEVEGESIESDFVVVSPHGIYILEVKNLGSGGSYGLYIEKDGRWNKVRGRNQEHMDSPVHQNERHILYLEKYINAELGRNLDSYLRVQGMVVLANDKVDIRNESDNLVLRYNNIMGTIRRQPVVMKEEDMKQIAEILLKAGLEPKKFPMDNYFNSYINAKIFTDDYLRWKESTKELKEFVDTYMKEHVNSQGMSYV